MLQGMFRTNQFHAALVQENSTASKPVRAAPGEQEWPYSLGTLLLLNTAPRQMYADLSSASMRNKRHESAMCYVMK
jgi:hypothetical protein